jgi:hypothetical protein
MSRALLRGLRSRGIEVTTVLEEGKAGDSDQVQLEYASQIRRVLYSFNVRDFCRLHKQYLSEGRSHAGIVVVYRQRYSIGEQLRLLLKLADMKSAEDMNNTLLFL